MGEGSGDRFAQGVIGDTIFQDGKDLALSEI